VPLVVVVQESTPLLVNGLAFEASNELKCAFRAQGSSAWFATAAYFVSETAVKCQVPPLSALGPAVTVGSRAEVSVANFGEDYASDETVTNYKPLYVQLACQPGFSGVRCDVECSGRGERFMAPFSVPPSPTRPRAPNAGPQLGPPRAATGNHGPFRPALGR
jgi:hypothetical protein